jgi:hypothetical protein
MSPTVAISVPHLRNNDHEETRSSSKYLIRSSSSSNCNGSRRKASTNALEASGLEHKALKRMEGTKSCPENDVTTLLGPLDWELMGMKINIVPGRFRELGEPELAYGEDRTEGDLKGILAMSIVLSFLFFLGFATG